MNHLSCSRKYSWLTEGVQTQQGIYCRGHDPEPECYGCKLDAARQTPLLRSYETEKNIQPRAAFARANLHGAKTGRRIRGYWMHFVRRIFFDEMKLRRR